MNTYPQKLYVINGRFLINFFLVIFQVDNTYFNFLKCSLGYLSGVMSRNMLYVIIIVDYKAINVVFIKAYKIVSR